MNTLSFSCGCQALVLTTVLLLVQPPRAAADTAPVPGSLWLQWHGMQFWEWDIDHDGDGFTTREEYRFGTNPRDASSRPGEIRLFIEMGPSNLPRG